MRREFALPGTRARYARDRAFDIHHYRIEVDLDVEGRTLTGRCAITLAPIAAGARWLGLDAVELDIQRVRRGEEVLEHSHDGKTLRVDLGAATVGEAMTIEVEYRGRPRRGLYFVGPDEHYPDKPVQVWSQGQDEDSRFWFPCFDAPHEKATSEVIATVPARFFALSNGSLVSDESVDGRRTMHWRFDTPHSCYLITLVAGELCELRDQWEDVEVTYYGEPAREDQIRRTLGRTPEMLALFSERFGVRYPYDKYAQVFVADFIFGGMENTTATTLTDLVLLDERAALDHDVEALVAHELAHQWFGDLLTCRDWGESWLNEGFATYSEYLWREHAEGRDAAALELEEFAEQYFGEDSSRYRRTVATKLYEEPIDVFDHHLYEKGARVIHMLRRILGEDGFWAAIQHYLSKHRGGSVETRDLARAVEDATGRVLDWFFGQWITEGAGHPELKVVYAWDSERKLAELAVTQTQKVEGETPLFRLPTHIRFRIGDEDCDFALDITETQQTFYLPLEAEPSQAIFDPGRHLLAKIDMTKGLGLWRAELAGASEAIDRMHAARALARAGGLEAEAALIHALEKDAFWGVRAAAATALGTLRTDSAREALIAAIASTAHPRARRAVVKALGQFLRDERAAEALAGVVEHGDDSYFVEAEACLALGKTRSPRAPAALRVAAERDSYTDVIRRMAYQGLAEARDQTAIELLLDRSRYGHGSMGRRGAVAALAQLARGRRDREALEVRERIEEYLQDRDFRVQYGAIGALADIGDPAAIGALRQLADRDLDGRLRRRSREVIRDLESGRAQEDAVNTLRDELEELRSLTMSLRQRLDKLEAGAGAKTKNKHKSKSGSHKSGDKDKKKKKS